MPTGGAQPVRPFLNVLVLEDDLMLLDMFDRMLGRLGFGVLLATTMSTAAKLLDQGDVACVIVNESFGRLDQATIVATIRHLAPAMPIIVASADDPLYVARLPEAGVTLLGLPVHLDVLASAIEAALLVPPAREEDAS